MKILAAAALTSVLGIATGVSDACEVHSVADHPHVIELYTSEGCDSCPPAEHWMSSLRGHSDVIGLEFHIDYWDSSEWHDPFDDKSYTERQKALSKRVNHNQYYTPQVWLDGSLWRDWPKGAPPNPSPAAAPSISMTATVGDAAQIELKADSSFDSANFRFFAGITENNLSSSVRGGENRGKKLAHDQVVRAFSGPLEMPQAKTELKLPANLNPANASVIAFVQDQRDGNIVQALTVPLSQCKK